MSDNIQKISDEIISLMGLAGNSVVGHQSHRDPKIFAQQIKPFFAKLERDVTQRLLLIQPSKQNLPRLVMGTIRVFGEAAKVAQRAEPGLRNEWLLEAYALAKILPPPLHTTFLDNFRHYWNAPADIAGARASLDAPRTR